jgi:hypothetical protein
MQARVSTYVGRVARGWLLAKCEAGTVKAEPGKCRPAGRSTLDPGWERWHFDSAALLRHGNARGDHAHTPSYPRGCVHVVCSAAIEAAGPITRSA